MRHASDLAHAAEVLKIARISSREQFIKRFEHRLLKTNYKPGELVLIQNSCLEMTVNHFKTHPRYLGPYEVAWKTHGGSYKLKELDGVLFKKNVAAFRLYPYITRNSAEFQKLMEPLDPNQYMDDMPPDANNSDGDQEQQ